MSFGEAVRRIRIARGLTQAQVAKRLGLGRADVCHAENERSMPRAGTVLAYARALEVKPDALIEVAQILDRNRALALAAHYQPKQAPISRRKGPRGYSDETRAKALEVVRETANMSEAARRLRISEQTISRWCHERLLAAREAAMLRREARKA